MLPREIIKKIRRIEIHTSRIVDELLAGQWNSAFKGRGIEFEEVRPYQIGDDVRAIDWNVTARMGRPFIKLFREEREMAVMLLVDQSASQSLGTHWQTKRELVTELSATLAFSAGTFLCIALSDLLPELQFHAHDRWPLSMALLGGFALMAGAGAWE